MSAPTQAEKLNKIPIGLIINPIAGMGGAVGLKGSDGTEILYQARTRGATPQANLRAAEFLQEIRGLKTKIKIVTIPGVMGGDTASAEGFQVEFVSDDKLPVVTKLYETTPEYTILAAKCMKAKGVPLLVFVGGDGTARNIFEAVGLELPILGIPGGVKIHSSVFANNPRAAGLLGMAYLWGEAPLREAEVLDIDEDAFRDNRVVSRLYGYMQTPYMPEYSQPSKMGTPQTEYELENQQSIARWIVEEMERQEKEGDQFYYLLGPGTTPRGISSFLNVDKTLLGVDLLFQKQIIARDLNETQILSAIQNKKVKLIVTPIGAQGFIFGRGNLQLSPKVLKQIGTENILIIATKYKLDSIPDHNLRIDSRDPDFDAQFAGYFRVLVEYGEYRIVNVVAN